MTGPANKPYKWFVDRPDGTKITLDVKDGPLSCHHQVRRFERDGKRPAMSGAAATGATAADLRQVCERCTPGTG